MSRYSGPKDKIAKRYKINLWGRPKNPIKTTEKSGPQRRTRKKSEYGIRLEEKQKLKFFYGGISERQFTNTYKRAKKQGGNIGNNFILQLESRLDVVVYRLNLVPTIFAARQIASHGHVLVNDRKVNIPSYKVKPGDVVKIKTKSKDIPLIQSHVQHPEREMPLYLSFNKESLSGKVEREPEREDIHYPFELNESLIIEFYSM